MDRWVTPQVGICSKANSKWTVSDRDILEEWNNKIAKKGTAMRQYYAIREVSGR